MSVRIMEREISRFLLDKSPEVMAIKGPWGVGKTYWWNYVLDRVKADGNTGLEKYAYVSLFGINSLSDLRRQVFQQTQGIRDKVAPNVESFSTRIGEFAKRWRKLETIREVPALKNFLPDMDSLTFLSAKDTIICLDDLERMGTGLDLADCMGLVSALKEQRNCKVVLIFNDDYLERIGKDSYQTYREKVVDIELRFMPQPMEAVEIALSESPELLERVRESVIQLDIANIRIIKKIEKTAKLILPILARFEPEVTNNALKTLVLLIWCYYNRGNDDIPPYEYVKRNTGHASFYGFFDSDKLSGQEKQWNLLLQEYGYLSTDEFDLQIAATVENGFIDDEKFLEQAEKIDSQIKHSKSEESFSEAWKLYHDTFENNEHEVVQGLYESFKKNVKHISPVNLNGTVRLFRELGKYELADKIISLYVEARKDEPILFDLSQSPFSTDISEEKVQEAFRQAHAARGEKRTLKEVVASMVENNGWNINDEDVLDAATVEDYYNLFKAERGSHLHSYVNVPLRFIRIGNASDKHHRIGQKAKEALLRIAAESELNHLRVRRYGVLAEGEY